MWVVFIISNIFVVHVVNHEMGILEFLFLEHLRIFHGILFCFLFFFFFVDIWEILDLGLPKF
jgi:hypothetical protein